MSYAIVYSSKTGNTKLLADTIFNILPKQDCIYIGEPSEKVLQADTLYIGFWTDKGRCNDEIKAFLKTLTNQDIFLFGTCGFGQDPTYFTKILNKVKSYLPSQVNVLGEYMCQGKMPMSVRARYEKMAKAPIPIPNMKKMIENFDQALEHPNTKDINLLKESINQIIG